MHDGERGPSSRTRSRGARYQRVCPDEADCRWVVVGSFHGENSGTDGGSGGGIDRCAAGAQQHSAAAAQARCRGTDGGIRRRSQVPGSTADLGTETRRVSTRCSGLENSPQWRSVPQSTPVSRQCIGCVAMARRLQAECPDAYDAWKAGDICQERAMRINRALRRLVFDSSKQLVNASVVDVAAGQTPELLGRWLNQFVARQEPEQRLPTRAPREDLRRTRHRSAGSAPHQLDNSNGAHLRQGRSGAARRRLGCWPSRVVWEGRNDQHDGVDKCGSACCPPRGTDDREGCGP